MDILLDGTWRYLPITKKISNTEKFRTFYWIVQNYDKLEEISIPCCQTWEELQKDNIQSQFYYLKLPDIPYRPESHEYSIEFNGLNYYGIIWLNGQKIGDITGGTFKNRIEFLPEILSIKDDNFLAVQVFPKCLDKDLPFDKHQWQDCYGIYQSVEILLLERTRIKKIQIETQINTKYPTLANIEVNFIIKHPQDFFERCYAFQIEPQISYEIFYLGRFFNGEPQINPVLIQTDSFEVSASNIEPLHHVDHDLKALKKYFADSIDPNEYIEGTMDLATFYTSEYLKISSKEKKKPYQKREKEIDDFRLKKDLNIQIKNPILWTPQDPNLYQLKLHLHGIDQDKKVRFGIRSISTIKNHLFLNHSLLQIHGLCYPLRIPSEFSCSDTNRRKEILQIKNLGFNAIRLNQGALADDFLDITDEEGLLVVQDFVLNPYWQPSKQKSYIKIAKILSEFIQRDINHPSLIMWSLGQNISYIHKASIAYLTPMLELTRKWDKTRIISYSSSDIEQNTLAKLKNCNAIELKIPKSYVLISKLYLLLYVLYYFNRNTPVIISELIISHKNHKKTNKKEQNQSEKTQQLILQKIIPLFSNFSGIAGWFLASYHDFGIKSNKASKFEMINPSGLFDMNDQPKKIVKWIPKLQKMKIKIPSNPFLARILQVFIIIYEIFIGKMKKFFMVIQQ